ncbi:UPF0057 membrane protein [Balamuthia mandrillaris]
MLGDILLAILAIFLPFVPVLIKRGCGGHFLLNILLCIIGWLPGVIHAWFVIFSTPEEVHVYHHHPPSYV